VIDKGKLREDLPRSAARRFAGIGSDTLLPSCLSSDHFLYLLEVQAVSLDRPWLACPLLKAIVARQTIMAESEGPANGRTLIITEGILSSLGPAPTFLRRTSIRLLSARTGSEVLTLAGTSDPGLLLLEYSMPVMKGDQVCRRLRADKRLVKVPVIIVGPPEPPRIEVSCRKSGCSLFSPAPVDFSRLLPRVAEYLGVAQRQEERLSVVLSISYGTVKSEVLGRSMDLSSGGMLVRTPTPLRVGFFVNLRFNPDKGRRSIMAQGRIRRTSPTEEGEYDVGIQFLTLPVESVDRIEKVLQIQRSSPRS
jgi:CheY-like chemotaxis protein